MSSRTFYFTSYALNLIYRIYGVILNQAVIYYRTYSKDPAFMKYWVRELGPLVTRKNNLLSSQVATAL